MSLVEGIVLIVITICGAAIVFIEKIEVWPAPKRGPIDPDLKKKINAALKRAGLSESQRKAVWEEGE